MQDEGYSDEEVQFSEFAGVGGERGIDYPVPPSKDSIFKFFREILNKLDSSKVANLENKELGMLPHTVRRYIDLSNYASVEELDGLAAYMMAKAETISSTSMSKKGFFTELFVTQIKKDKKVQPVERKQGFFSSLGRRRGD